MILSAVTCDTVVICHRVHCVCVTLGVFTFAFVCSLSDIDHIRKQTPEQAQPGGVGVGHTGTSQHLRKQHKTGIISTFQSPTQPKAGGGGGGNHNSVKCFSL